jgi:hypothetical protein
MKAVGYSMWAKNGFIVRNQKVLANAMATGSYTMLLHHACMLE